MTRYLGRRLAHMALVLLIVSAMTFTIVTLAPGGPSVLVDPQVTPEDQAKLRALLGLDQPLYVQYGKWLGAIAQADLGRSLRSHRPVADVIGEKVPATLLLAGAALAVTVGIGVPLGIAAAVRRNSWMDHLASFFSAFGLAIPIFWLGIMLILFFSVTLRVLPAAGMYTIGGAVTLGDRIAHLVMPTIVLATFNLAEVVRYSRSSALNVLRQEFVRTARSKGLAAGRVLFRHVLKNACIPIVTVVGMILPRLVGGAPITETVFAWPGVGRLAVDAAFHRDYPVIMGITVMVSIAVVVSNLVVDLLYPVLDPRVRLE